MKQIQSASADVKGAVSGDAGAQEESLKNLDSIAGSLMLQLDDEITLNMDPQASDDSDLVQTDS